MKALLNLFVILATFLSCSEASIGDDYNSNYHSYIPTGKVLLIYGGQDYKVYLGKINANEFDSESIWNEFGKYGNRFSSISIWNEFGTYGNEYNSYSPFNDYASYPPILVDNDGNFYGYFTSNKYKTRRANLELIDIICDNYEQIRDDVSGWYDKIFY